MMIAVLIPEVKSPRAAGFGVEPEAPGAAAMEGRAA
jgi:hypothetical protein